VRWCAFFFISTSLLFGAEEHWISAKSAPFEVISNAGDKAVREKLAYLEQFQEAFSATIGKKDLHLLWPMRVVVTKGAQETRILLGRDGYIISTPESAPFSTAFRKQLARMLLDANANRMPESIENGLIALFSTLDVEGTHITLGIAIPQADRNRDWARMHLLTVAPDYAGRTRVFINNLEQGADFDLAYRNAFQKSGADIEKQIDAYLQSNAFGTTMVSAKTLNANRDIKPVEVEGDGGKIALADLLLAAGNTAAAGAAYEKLKGTGADEGRALIALKDDKEPEAKELLNTAIEADSKNARAWLELGELQAGPAKAKICYETAAKLNPFWGEPYRQLSLLEDDLNAQIRLLKKATAVEPRNIEYWQTLAKVDIAANNYVEAGKAWAGAERAGASPEERLRMQELRLKAESQRADFAESEKKRIAAEEASDLSRVKAQSEAAIHAAEAAANKKLNPDGKPVPKPVDWWNGDAGGLKVEGSLKRFDCLGASARLAVQSPDGKTTELLVTDPAQLMKTLACGAQKAARPVVVQYNARADAKFRTAGDVVSIEFH
jgi:hypothetical protein